MKQRGKRSTASLSVITPKIVDIPNAPGDLLPVERELWDSIIATRTSDFFDSATLPLLAEYCRLKTQVDAMAEEIKEFEPDWLKTDEGVRRYRALTSIRDQAQGRMIALARSMRLTQQARYVPDHTSSKPGTARTKKLWERD